MAKKETDQSTSEDTQQQQANHVLRMTSDIICAFVKGNRMQAGDLTGLITTVGDRMQALSSGSSPSDEINPKTGKKQKPAVPIKKSITPDAIICLEDGKRFKSLKRHLGSHYNMTPEEYRAKWGLPPDYPMVSPNYSKVRTKLAKQNKLGTARSGRGKNQQASRNA